MLVHFSHVYLLNHPYFYVETCMLKLKDNQRLEIPWRMRLNKTSCSSRRLFRIQLKQVKKIHHENTESSLCNLVYNMTGATSAFWFTFLFPFICIIVSLVLSTFIAVLTFRFHYYQDSIDF
jgi:hypothetical protein